MAVGEAHPLGLALVEAEITARPGPPLVVGGEPDPGVVEDLHHAVVIDAVVDEREPGLDVGLGRYIPLAVRLVGPNGHVRHGRRVADPLLDRLDLHVLGTPAHLWRRQRASEHLEPVVESPRRVQPHYGLPQDHFEPGQILIGLGQFRAGVAEEVLHIGNRVAEVHGQGAGVLAAGDAADVADPLSHGPPALRPRSGR